MPADRISPLPRQLLLTLHVAATAGVLGADLALLALGLEGLLGGDARAIYPAAHLLGARVVAPLALLSLGTGILLALLTRWGLFRYWWVTAKLIIAALLTGAVLLVLVPRLGAAADAVTAPAAPAPGRLPLALAPAVASLLLLLALALAVFKPPWRLRAPEARTTPTGG